MVVNGPHMTAVIPHSLRVLQLLSNQSYHNNKDGAGGHVLRATPVLKYFTCVSIILCH